MEIVDAIDDVEVRGLPPVSADSVKVDELADAKLIRDTHAQKDKISQDVFGNSSLEGRVANWNVEEFPHLAWESVKAGLAKEELTNRQINEYIKEAEECQKTIDLLLDFSTELTMMKEDQKEMSEKMRDLMAELKVRGIDLGDDFSKEKVSELKTLVNGKIDNMRSQLQILFTTKIQTLIQQIGTIMEIMKDIIRNNGRLVSAANRLPGH
jgi:uncharacterized protein YhaN